MSQQVSPEVLRKVRKLAQLPEEARRCRFAVSITRLTVLKSLCQEPEVANRFVTYLAQRTRQKVEEKARRPGYLSMEEWARHRALIGQSVLALEQYLGQPSEADRKRLWASFHEMVGEQNEYRRVYGGPVRQIKNNDLLLVEYAVRTVLADPASVPQWAYQTARCYAERYDSGHGTGLTPKSAPLVEDIVCFWMQEFGLTPEKLCEPTKKKTATPATPPATRPRQGLARGRKKVQVTPRQGQFLAFIHLYRKLHRRGPAELDMVQFFRVTPPAVHGMVVKLEELGLVTREPGVARSIRVAIPEAEIPALENVEGHAW